MASFSPKTRRREEIVSSSIRALLVLVCSFGLLFSLLPSTTADVLLGVFDPGQGRSMNQPLAMDRWQGKPNAIQTVFTTWDNSEMDWLFPALENIWKGNKIPLITWEPKWWSQWSPTDIEVRVANGEYDAYLITWGRRLKDFIAGPDGEVGTSDDRRAYMRFAHEMNGNWYPWSASTGQSTPADYVRMWRRVYNLFDSNTIGLPRSKVANSFLWVWSPINFDVGDFKMDQYYPGDAYVDWKGVTGFNWGNSEGWSGWWNPHRLFDDSIDRIKKIGNEDIPIGLTEYSSVPNGGDKNEWIQQVFNLCLAKDVRMALYFNIDKNEQSGMKYWSIFGYGGDQDFWDAASNNNWKGWGAYKNAVSNPRIVGANLRHPRVLTDAQFKGGFTSSPPEDPVIPSPKAPSPSTKAPRPSPIPEDDDNDEDPTDNGSDETDESDNGSDDGSNPKPTRAARSPLPLSRVLHVFKDSNYGTYDFLSWGSEETITDAKFQLSPRSPLLNASVSSSSSLIEGRKVLKVHSTGWGGCGFFLTDDQGTTSLRSYSRLRFRIATTKKVRVEIEDINGKKWTRIVSGFSSSRLAWRTVVLSLRHKSVTGTVIDFTRVKGLFLATAETETDFYIDSVRFEK